MNNRLFVGLWVFFIAFPALVFAGDVVEPARQTVVLVEGGATKYIKEIIDFAIKAGLAMLAVNIIVRLLSKPKKAG